jgi:hypothetical protein
MQGERVNTLSGYLPTKTLLQNKQTKQVSCDSGARIMMAQVVPPPRCSSPVEEFIPA